MHEPWENYLLNIALGVWVLAGILMLLLGADRYWDWEITPMLLAHIVLLSVVLVPSLAEQPYVLGFLLAAWLTSWVAPLIARRLKKSVHKNDSPTAAHV